MFASHARVCETMNNFWREKCVWRGWINGGSHYGFVVNFFGFRQTANPINTTMAFTRTTAVVVIGILLVCVLWAASHAASLSSQLVSAKVELEALRGQ